MSRKFYYNFEILYNKWSPFVISALIVLYHTLSFLTTLDLEWLEYCCFPSLLTSLHMYNSRQTFMLCKVHRCFVNYVVLNVLACIASHYWVVAYMNIYWFAFIMLGTITAMAVGLIYYTEEHGKINSRNAQKDC